MSSVLADFTGWFDTVTDEFDEPVEGRILLGEDRLILAASEGERVTISLSSVFDVAVGNDAAAGGLPGMPVTVAYENGTDRTTVAVAADESTAEKFRAVLFKTLLNGTSMTIEHPAKVGGRVVDGSFK